MARRGATRIKATVCKWLAPLYEFARMEVVQGRCTWLPAGLPTSEEGCGRTYN